MSKVRVVMAGGGTGGHIIPALAIADELKSSCGAEVLFVGTPRGLESRLVPQAGYPLELIPVGQLNNVSLTTKLRTLTDLPLSLVRCRALLQRFRADVVVGVGGYASGPAMMAAILARIPTLAFEPNAYPGLANRVIGKRVRAAAVNFAAALPYFRNAEVTGIPVRTEFFHLKPLPASAPPHLLVFGGSQGARIFNTLMPRVAPDLLDAVPGLTILHQAGARHAEATQAAFEASGAPHERWQVSAFLDDMPRRFEAASLIFARSGASTVAELCASGKPSLLVPFPQAADDHQRKNADALVAAGAARMLIERELTPEVLTQALLVMLSDVPRLQRMAQQAAMLAHPDAAGRIAAMVVKISRRQ